MSSTIKLYEHIELAKNEYLAWLEHKADRYTTVYGYMD